MKLNNEFTLDHKQGYWVVGLMKTSEETGNNYLSATKTYPTLEQATTMLTENNVDSKITSQVAETVYKEYLLEQSAVYLAQKKAAAVKKVKDAARLTKSVQ